MRPVLSCHFFRGRLFARLVTCDTEQKIINNNKSLESFRVRLIELTHECSGINFKLSTACFGVRLNFLVCPI